MEIWRRIQVEYLGGGLFMHKPAWNDCEATLMLLTGLPVENSDKKQQILKMQFPGLDTFRNQCLGVENIENIFILFSCTLACSRPSTVVLHWVIKCVTYLKILLKKQYIWAYIYRKLAWLRCYTGMRPIASLAMKDQYEESRPPLWYTKLNELGKLVKNHNQTCICRWQKQVVQNQCRKPSKSKALLGNKGT